MSKDYTERKAYRRSPGRQYGYEYDPLHSASGASRGEGSASRASAVLSQRPDPRLTRQLIRKSIIASRRLHEDELAREEQAPPADKAVNPRETRRIVHTQHMPPYEDHEETVERPRHYALHPTRVIHEVPEHWPSTSELMDPEELAEDAYPHDDPEYEETAVRYPHDYADDYAAQASRRAPSAPLRPRQARPTRVFEHPEYEDYLPAQKERSQRSRQDSFEEIDPAEEYDEHHIYEDHELPAGLRPVKRRKGVSRRGLLLTAGLAAAGLGGLAAVELAPKASQSTNNVEHQIKAAFDQGVAHGADSARKELLTALDNLEGFTLQGAIDAANLTRVAYDVFVSPIIQFGANLATDFLTAMLNAFKTARGVLAGVFQDNATLVAIQKVLQSWVDQSQKIPKQLTAITDTDLDGAQAYLRALQQKIADEKAKLNATPTPAPTATPKATPKPK